MSGFYRFPAMVLPSDHSRLDQSWKISEEVREVESARSNFTFTEKLGREDAPERRIAYGMELMDVIHAAETALRMEFDDEEVDALRDKVEEKNRVRGYYDTTSKFAGKD